MKDWNDLTDYQKQTVESYKNAAFNEAMVVFEAANRHAAMNRMPMNAEKAAEDAWKAARDLFDNRCRKNDWFVPFQHNRLAEHLDDLVRGKTKEHEEIVKKYTERKGQEAELDTNKEILRLKKLCQKQGYEVKIYFKDDKKKAKEKTK